MPRELIVADLTDDDTDVTGQFSTLFPHPHPPFVREAPAHFRRGPLHDLLTSGTTGYFPNASEVAVARAYHGSWTVLGDPHPQDETRTSYRSQICSVFKHPHKRDLYIALADRWLGDRQVDARKAASMLETAFASGNPSEHFARYKQEDPEVFAAPDTSRAGYVWLPVRFDGEMAHLDWHDEWRIEDYEWATGRRLTSRGAGVPGRLPFLRGPSGRSRPPLACRVPDRGGALHGPHPVQLPPRRLPSRGDVECLHTTRAAHPHQRSPLPSR